MAEIPVKQWISLHEAVTWLAYGEALDKNELVQKDYPSSRKYREAWSKTLHRCLDEAPLNGPFIEILRTHCRNPFNKEDINAVDVTAEELVSVRQHWPESGEELHRIALDWESARSIEERRERDALNEIVKAAIAGVIRLRGRRDNGKGTSRDYSDIDPAHLDHLHALNWRISTFGPIRSWPIEGQPDAYKIGHVRFIDDFYYDDVKVERAGLMALPRNSERRGEVEAASPKPVPEAELRRKFNAFRLLSGQQMNRELIRNWGRETFGQRITGTRLDALDREDAQNSPRTQGRRSK